MIQKEEAPNKHYEFDPAPTRLIKQCSDVLAPVIAKLANRSFVTVVFNEIARAMDTWQVCAMVLLDLSTAFDTVDHEIVMDVLERRFACHNAVKSWFCSYLTDRTRIYRVGSVSVPTRLMCGVQQGSIIGPSQFTAYTEDIKDIIHTTHTDACQGHSSITNWSMLSWTWGLHIVRSTLVRGERLQLNLYKTEFICLGSAVQLQRL